MRPLLPALALALAACANDVPPAAPAPRPVSLAPDRTAGELPPCDPLVPTQCGMPFPNAYYLAADPTTDTGYRVAIPPEMVPRDRAGQGFDPAEWNRLDGFPIIPPILAHLPGLSLRGMARSSDIDRSLEEDSPTVLLDADTGARVPHWAELDASTADADRRALFLWPARALEPGHRYIVALRGLVQEDGAPVAPSEAFLALRDALPSDDVAVESRRAHYEELFATLAQAGVARDDLQLAWDWVTVSDRAVSGWLLHMRDDALAQLPEGGPRYRIDEVIDDPEVEIARQIEGHMRVPLYLSTAAPTARSHLVLGADGLPEMQGWAWVPFTVTIPRSVADDPRPSLVMQYGHGMFGERQEITYGWARAFFDRYGYVAGATDWWGMAQEDVPSVVVTCMGDLARFRTLPDRIQQGVVNALALMRLMTGDLTADPALAIDGIPVLDPTRLAYYGNSQGGILGGVYLAMSDQVERGVIGVGGTPYAMMLYRSANFAPFYEIFNRRYPDPLDQALLIGLIQMLWDRGEPAGYLRHMTTDPLPGLGPHTLLFQTAIGDAQVPNLASDLYGRSVGATLIDPAARPIWGMPLGPAPLTTSAYVESDSGAPPVPDVNVPPDPEEDTHEDPRRVPALQDQIDHFVRTGEIVHTCDGPCDPD